MRMWLVGLPLTLAALIVVGCKDEVKGQNPGTGGAVGSGGANGSGGAGGVSGTGGAGGLAGCSDLSGTWDVMASSPGNPSDLRSWVLVIGANRFSFSDSLYNLDYTAEATKQATWTAPGSVRPIAITNTSAAVNAGVLPLAVGGTWMFSSGSGQCTASIAAVRVTASCQGPGNEVGGPDWPYPVPNPTTGRLYAATRISQLASQLGDFGGDWQVTNNVRATCAVTLSGNRMTATCTQAGALSGSLQMTLGNDCVASGANGGLEISARRR